MRRLVILLVLGAAVGPACGAFFVVPSDYANYGGTNGLSTQFHYNARTYQVAIDPLALTGLPDGAEILGLTWRIRAVATYPTWPPQDVTFSAYDIQVSRSNYPAGSLSTNFAANIGPDVVLARSGPLTIPAGSFPGGAEWPPDVNPFGYEIMFSTPYTYRAGDTLLFTIRHTGNGAGTYCFLDSLANSTMWQALGAVGYNATSGSASYFSIMKIIYVPEPTAFALLIAGSLLLRRVLG